MAVYLWVFDLMDWQRCDTYRCNNLAEIILHAVARRAGFYAGLSLMVWILKREVRAFGGCLGTYRR